MTAHEEKPFKSKVGDDGSQTLNNDTPKLASFEDNIGDDESPTLNKGTPKDIIIISSDSEDGDVNEDEYADDFFLNQLVNEVIEEALTGIVNAIDASLAKDDVNDTSRKRKREE